MAVFYVQPELPERFLGLALSGIFLSALILMLVLRVVEIKRRKV